MLYFFIFFSLMPCPLDAFRFLFLFFFAMLLIFDFSLFIIFIFHALIDFDASFSLCR